jgi:hypothetical protein
MEIQIYVQSAGISQEQDYFWQKISNSSQQTINEPELVQEFKHLLNSQAYSILVGRKREQLILLVTGMKASKRKDYRGRILRNSIAFIADATSENERTIRGLAVAALKNDLEQSLDKAIQSGDQSGFEVDYQKIESLINQFASNIVGNEDISPEPKIGKNSEQNMREVADELAENSLPKRMKRIETLIVVTEAKNEATLNNARVWRGLSNLVKSEKLVKYNMEEFSLEKLCHPFKILFSGIGLIVGSIVLILIFNPFKCLTPNYYIPLAVISSNGQYIAVNDVNSELTVKDKTNKLIAEVPVNQESPIKSIAISYNGKYVATGNANGEVWLYSVHNGNLEKIANQVQHNGEVLSVAIMVSDKSSGGNKPGDTTSKKSTITIVSGGNDGTVKILTHTLN